MADSIHILAGDSAILSSGEGRQDRLALLFCIIITVFSILFGTRHVSTQRRNTGLVTAIAFESLVKLTAMMVLLLAAIYQVFGGYGDMEQWLLQNPQQQLATEPTHPGGKLTRATAGIFCRGGLYAPHIPHGLRRKQ